VLEQDSFEKVDEGRVAVVVVWVEPPAEARVYVQRILIEEVWNRRSQRLDSARGVVAIGEI